MFESFNKKQLIEKISLLGQSNLIIVTSIIKTTSIGFAIVVFLNLFLELGPNWDWEKILNMVPYFSLWIVTFLCLLVTYDATMTSSIFFVHIPKWYEVFLIFLLVGNESILFALLKLPFYSEGVLKETKQVLGVLILNWYFIVFICYCIIIYLIIIISRRAIRISLNEGRFKEDAKGMVNSFLKDSRTGVLFPIASFITSAISFCFVQFGNQTILTTQIAYVAFSIIIVTIAIAALIKLNRERIIIETI